MFVVIVLSITGINMLHFPNRYGESRLLFFILDMYSLPSLDSRSCLLLFRRLQGRIVNHIDYNLTFPRIPVPNRYLASCFIPFLVNSRVLHLFTYIVSFFRVPIFYIVIIIVNFVIDHLNLLLMIPNCVDTETDSWIFQSRTQDASSSTFSLYYSLSLLDHS